MLMFNCSCIFWSPSASILWVVVFGRCGRSYVDFECLRHILKLKCFSFEDCGFLEE